MAKRKQATDDKQIKADVSTTRIRSVVWLNESIKYTTYRTNNRYSDKIWQMAIFSFSQSECQSIERVRVRVRALDWDRCQCKHLWMRIKCSGCGYLFILIEMICTESNRAPSDIRLCLRQSLANSLHSARNFVPRSSFFSQSFARSALCSSTNSNSSIRLFISLELLIAERASKKQKKTHFVHRTEMTISLE